MRLSPLKNIKARLPRMLVLIAFPAALAGCQAIAPSTAGGTHMPAEPWVSDLGDGRYQNPVLHADYADPDVIRVGDTYYMTSSSFNSIPALPLMESKDMINWEIVGHAVTEQIPLAHFAVPRHGAGVWAPALRHHEGKFHIFYPDPDYGIYVTTASDFKGPWSAPKLLLPGRGLIDPAPLWDEDGKAYLVHGWAKSRSGINNILTLRRMAPDASAMLDTQGRDIVDANKLAGYHTLEGPKLYKHDGYYYIFAPAGGVETGWQAVFRARKLEGPYEHRKVMDQGETHINGPHQGAWVRTAAGTDWFYHFQDKQAYGRVVHLQPMRWADGWPIIGENSGRPGTGQPVTVHAKPVPGSFAIKVPPTSDEFSTDTLGLQWQWNANRQPGWHSLAARPGKLRLYTQVAPEAAAFLRAAPSLLTQKLPAPAFTLDTHIEMRMPAEGDRAGLILNGMSYAWLGLRKTAHATELAYTTCAPLSMACTEHSTVILPDAPQSIYLRMVMKEGGLAEFFYSVNNRDFRPVAAPFPASRGRWVGAQVGLFSVGNKPSPVAQSYLDVDYFRVTR